MKNFIILIFFYFGLSLCGGSELFPFGMNHTVYEQFYSFTEDIEYKEKYQCSMDWTATAGIKWWRPQYVFTWYSVQPNTEDEYYWNFDTEDSLVKWAGERGLHLLPSIGYTAGWARHPDTEPLPWLNKYRYPPDPTKWYAYKKYIETLVERYDGDGINDMPGLDSLTPIKYWECMNEPYGEYFLGTPGQYVEMFESTRVALKSADPDAKIVGPCMTTRDTTFEWKYFDPKDSKIKTDDFGYTSWQNATYSIIFDSIGLNYIDVISHHIYNNTANFMKYTRELRDILEQYPGGENKPIWITETGFNRTDLYKGERGTSDFCTSSPCVNYSSDSGEVFCDYVWARWNDAMECDSIPADTFLNIGDTVILVKRFNWGHDTIIYNGGNLIYKNQDTALAIGDTLRIKDIWAEDAWHTEFRQDSLYSEFLDSVIKTPNFLKNLKVFFFDASNAFNREAYPPRIEFGMESDDTSYRPTRYYRQHPPSVYSVIDTDNNPYAAYYSIRDSILKPEDQTLPSTIVNTGQTKTYQAMNSITTNDFKINNGGKVAMEAGDRIYLGDGFKVEEGGYFYGAANPRYGVGIGMSSMKGVTISNAIKTPDESVSKGDSIPKVFSCSQNSPNPFNINTTIRYGLPKSSNVSLCIYNLAGQKVQTLVDAEQSAGYKSISWDGRTSTGTKLPQGIYFYVFKASDFEKHRKMIMLK